MSSGDVYLIAGNMPGDGSDHMVDDKFVMQDCMDCMHYQVCRFHSVLLKGKESGKLPIDFSTASCLHYLSESALGEGLEEGYEEGREGSCGGGCSCGHGRDQEDVHPISPKVAEKYSWSAMSSGLVSWQDYFISNLYGHPDSCKAGYKEEFNPMTLDLVGRLDKCLLGSTSTTFVDVLVCQILSQMALLAGRPNEVVMKISLGDKLFSEVCESLDPKTYECSKAESSFGIRTVLGKVVIALNVGLKPNEIFSEVKSDEASS